MTYQDVLQEGARIFDFHPDEPFTSVEQILYTARKNNFNFGLYSSGATNYAETLARYADEKGAEE